MTSDPNKRNQRLNELFADLEQEAVYDQDSDKALPGWTWTCDVKTNYTYCSPEVEQILGVESAAFIGKSLTTFQLAAESQTRLRALIEKQSPQSEIELTFLAENGNHLAARMYLYYISAQADIPSSWRGFVQVLQDHLSPPLTSTTSLSLPTGAAIQSAQLMTVASPFSPIGEQSLTTRQTIVHPASPDSPATLAVPIDLQQQALGLLEFVDERPGRQWSDEERHLVEEVANQLSLALENASLFGEIQQRVQDLTMLTAVSQAVADAPLASEEVAQVVARQFVQSMQVEEASVSLLTDPRTLTIIADLYLGKESQNIQPFSIGTSTALADFPATHEVLRTQKVLVVQASDPDANPQELAYMQANNVVTLVIIPMVVTGQPIGVIELEAFEKERHYTPQELELAVTLASQAAVALENSRLFEETQQRAQELVRLNEAGQTISTELDLDRLTDQLAETAREIVNAHYSGLLVFHPNPSQAPYFKVSGVDFKRFKMSGLPEGKGVLSAILEGETIIIEDISQHERSIGLPEEHFPIKRLLGIPLIFQGQSRGILLGGRDGNSQPFTEAEFSLFQAYATTAVIAIENARLFQQISERSEELALINRIVSQVAASLDLDESLQIITTKLGQALNVQTGFALLDAQKTTLKVVSDYNPDSKFPPSLGMEVPVGGNPSSEKAIATKQPVIVDDAQSDPTTELIHDTMKELGIFSLAIYPLVLQHEVVGTLGLGIQEKGRTFTDSEKQLVENIITQASTAIQNARLFAQVQTRSAQLQTAAEVSRAASSILEPNPLILQAVNLIRDRFELYYVGIFLIDDDGSITGEPDRWAVLRAGTGDAGRIQIEQGHKLEIGGSSMIGQSVKGAQARISLLAPDEAQRFSNPHLPNTLSEMALPLISRGRVIGAMTIQSEQANAFSEEDIAVLQTMADQVANALQNANLFDQTQARTEELTILNQMSMELGRQLVIDDIIQTIYQFTSRLMNTNYFFVSLYDDKEDTVSFPLVIENNEAGQIPPMKKRQGLTQHVIDTKEPLLIYENVEEVIKDLGLENIVVGEPAQSWLGVPLLIGDQVLGVIATQDASKPRVFNAHHQELLLSIARQSAIAIQNARSFAQTQEALAETEALFNITNVASRSLKLQEMLDEVLAQVLEITGFQMGLISIFDPASAQLELSAHRGLYPAFLSSLIEKGLSGSLCELVYIRQELVNINDLSQGAPIDVSGLLALGIQSYLGVPLEVRDNILGTLCAFSTEKDASQEAIDLMKAVGLQIGVAIENANLFEQTQSALGRTAALYEVSRSVLAIAGLEDLLQSVVDNVSKNLPANRVTLITFNLEQKQVGYFMEGGPGAQHVVHVPFEELLSGLSGWVLNHKEPALSPKGVPDPRESAEAQQRRIETNCGAIIVAPLIYRDEILGTMTAINLPDEPDFTQTDVDMMMAMATQAAIAMRNTELFRQTQRQLANISTIQETTADLSAALTLDGVVNTLLAHITAAVSSDSANLFMLDGTELTRVGIYPRRDDNAPALGEKLSLADYPLTQQVIETQRPISTTADDLQLQDHASENFREAGIAANATIPIAGPEGVIGTVSLSRNRPNAQFSQDELDLMATLANQAAVAIQNARLYEEQRATAEQLRELDQLKSQFLANMSHELRTPLNSIIGFSRVIMKGIDGPVTDQQQQDLSAIYSAGQHLLNMINDILDISKIEAGKMELAFEDVELPQIFESVMSTARGLVKDKPVKLVANIAEDLPLVHADPTRIRQILLNLLSNAAKFTDEGTITLSAILRTAESGRPEIYISVTDTGVGISPDDQHDLFEPFTQVDGSPTRKTGGTGLGLSISRLLVDLHNGEINMTSHPGRGSTFYFTLPLSSRKKQTVLAVDADLQVTELYQRYLLDSDYQIVPVTNPTDVVSMALEYQPFAITLDLVLSEHNAWEILQVLKDDPGTHHIPVIICSIREEQEKAIQMGAADYLQKPILSNDLVNALNRVRNKERAE